MIRRLIWLCPLWLMIVAPSSEAAIHTQAVDYRHDGAALEGYLAYDDAVDGARPGILVIHEWRGLNDYAKRRAEQLAQLGYVAFAADMYGKGIYAKDHEEAATFSGAYRHDRALMRARARAALDVLRQHPLTDPSRLGAIGYCFGGTAVLELARAGAPLAGVVVFHGALDTPHPEDARQITGKVLVLSGADDPFAGTPAHIETFKQEMTQAGVDFRLVAYPGAVHSFTVPEAGNDPSTGAAYHAEADRRSWSEVATFFGTLFQQSSS